jgi:hypothetical protein
MTGATTFVGAKRGQDPSVKMLRSGFGSQCKSTMESEPQIGFGTSIRETSSKVRNDEHGPQAQRKVRRCCCVCAAHGILQGQLIL